MNSNVVKESASRSIMKSKEHIPSSKTVNNFLTNSTKEQDSIETSRIPVVPMINKYFS